ncbi:MAG: tRNA (adenosine(37)-N6)-threonylcarbamoyltransferase complex transferase subunit TsaD [Acidobacteria bacterium]|nr:tRNA (adenosine(37)-N6)-threonylcarbamoyltransferase complex transferase subunit TsaD [Acidobacteriota bacterium]
MRILGIESSCDETAAAVVEDGSRVLSSVVASQVATHGKYGGVVPELASREHLRNIVPVVRMALTQSGSRYPDLAAVAATAGPGLVGSLLVGLTYAKALSLARDLPLIAVNHLEGHIHAVLLESRGVELPAVALVASGGHTHLFEVRPHFEYRLLGKTRDDAAGEAFDKVAKMLGFSYPGGPVLEAIARTGNPLALRFPAAKMKGNPLDFSFSGLKTAVLRWVEAHDMGAEIAARRALLRASPRPALEQWLALTPQATRDLVASFERTVVSELLRRASAAAESIQARSLIITGGVAANSALRAAARRELAAPAFFPSLALSTDNAAMIAATAFAKLEKRELSDFSAPARAGLELAEGHEGR